MSQLFRDVFARTDSSLLKQRYDTTMEMFPFSLAASRLSKRGIAVIKCNLSLLYSSSSNKQKGRTELVNRNLIDAVIELPPELLSEPGETAALVIIRKGRKEDTIHMINARRADDVSPVSIYRSPDSYYDPDREVHALVPRQEILANGANLCAGPYLKKDLRYHTGDAELSVLLTRRDDGSDAGRFRIHQYVSISYFDIF